MAREQTIVLYIFQKEEEEEMKKINMSVCVCVCVCVWNNRLFRSCQNLWGEKTLEIKRNKPT
jgi:hypothetical protein